MWQCDCRRVDSDHAIKSTSHHTTDPLSPTPIHPLLDNIYSFYRSPATRVKSHSVGGKSPHQLLYGWRKDVPLPSPVPALCCLMSFAGLYSKQTARVWAILAHLRLQIGHHPCLRKLAPVLYYSSISASALVSWTGRSMNERVREDGYRTLNDDYLWQA